MTEPAACPEHSMIFRQLFEPVSSTYTYVRQKARRGRELQLGFDIVAA